MTAVVGIASTAGTVWLGADSQATDCDHGKASRSHPKVFKNGCVLIGYAGSFRVGQILQYKTKYRQPKQHESTSEWMILQFVPAFIQALKVEGLLCRGGDIDTSLLVGVRGHLYSVDTDFSVHEYADRYAAIGMGGDLCRGVLYALADKRIAPRAKIIKALEAAEHFNGSVGRPFVVLQSRTKQVYE